MSSAMMSSGFPGDRPTGTRSHAGFSFRDEDVGSSIGIMPPASVMK
jgi:hypothetical protein